jgi:cytochrome c
MKLLNGRQIVAVAALALGAAPLVAAPAGDPAKGKSIFVRCAICHSVEPGKNMLGPSLNGVIGRQAGTVTGFNYSPAMKAAKISWTTDNLSKFLANPRATVAGTKMIFAGLPNEADRANLIAYLAKPK